MMLYVKDISLSLGKIKILQGVSLEAAAGELCVIMGANGAGKSTLLKVIAGEYMQYQGSVMIGEKELKTLPVAAQARTRAVLSQQLTLNQPFTVTEVVSMGRYIYNAHLSATDKEIITYALKVMQIQNLRDRTYLTLSGGQKQRVQMARVLAQLLEAPDLQATDYTGRKMLLLDEPVTGMDILHQQLSLQLASTLAASGVLVVAVLHDFQLAAAYASRLLMLKDGRVYAQGTVEEIFTSAHIKNCFGVDVSVLEHPHCHYPLVVTAAAGGLFQSPAQKALKVM
ncbi:heme ABC transporter ATP-binding protein [Chitinophaga filiformis]|uniref:Iron complex transport system ATP-binding protein n=1 Tax=Chitinophaga filiformis TaxID=104663 RepID=A0A1G7HAV9_CHIFI|nr:heme ABC transporter ATP-binding protein [Chitinophaga filiformis]SDE97516.1 iron complex transport system ATP-binding protein [Chitinophaga filiformis]